MVLEQHDDAEEGEWLTIAAAARRLGVTPRAIRSRIKHNSLPWKPNGNMGKLVLVPHGEHTREEPDDPEEALREEIEELREALGEARIVAARAEAQRDAAIAAKEEATGSLRERIEELRRELEWHRRSWWRRLIG